MKNKINGLIMFVGGLALIFLMIIPQYKITTSEPQNIYEMNADEIVEGTHITGEIDFIYDYCHMNKAYFLPKTKIKQREFLKECFYAKKNRPCLRAKRDAFHPAGGGRL